MNFFGMVNTSKSADYTPHALKSFFGCTPLASSDRFYLIDNDGSYRPSDDSPPILKLLRNQEPNGFAGNVNQIMRLAALHKADLFFLNNDIIFTPRWFEPLLSEQPAIVSPVSNWQVQHRCANFECKAVMDLQEYIGHEQELIEIVQRHGQINNGIFSTFVIGFFCVKIPYSVYSAVGELDERFGRGGAEDFDYCLRCHLAGFGVCFALPSFVLHFSGKSTAAVEAPQIKSQREETFGRAFIGKWGLPLFELAFLHNKALLERDPQLLDSFNRGDFQSVVKKLMSKS
jgi:GT2 family glycosyltransferase